MKKFPVLTLVILIGVVIIHFFRGSFGMLVYDRQYVLAGEWWRMLTGHLVHGSLEHLIRDGASFLFFGAIVEHRLKKSYLLYLIAGSLMLSFGYLFFNPETLRYFGLSGIITGLCGYLLMQELPRTWNEGPKYLFVFYVIVASVLVFKVGYEFLSGGSFFYRAQAMTAAPEAHVMGLVSGVLAWALQKGIQKDHVVTPIPRPSLLLALTGGVIWLAMVFFW